MRYVIDLAKAQPVQSEDGVLTRLGMRLAHEYARAWIEHGVRNLELERKYPELTGLFYDIRIDPALAREHAAPI